ncbi:MAG: zinc-dependent alcohol dehydrogenase family protein [Myxococcota bacterium]
MKAMVLRVLGQPLQFEERATPTPSSREVLLEVDACAICRTDLHVIDGELPGGVLPIIPGHQVVGRVQALGSSIQHLRVGERVGVSWLASSCGECDFCTRGMENLCRTASFHGFTRDGGFASHMVADADYVFPLPAGGQKEAAERAPLLCGGLIGFRALRFTGDAHRIGLYGFGNAAHLIAQVAHAQGRRVFAFSRRRGDEASLLARRLGVHWVGTSDEVPPEPLDAAIVFAPVGELIPRALAAVGPGGVVVCAGIHMSDVPSFPYRLLWGERTLRSVANMTREDGRLFLPLAEECELRASVTSFPLESANEALLALRRGTLSGAAVLLP